MAEWSAPVDRWVRRATDRDGKALGAPTRLLLDDLWSKADAPTKREPGPAFVYGRWVELAALAAGLLCDVRSIGRQLGHLKAAGLVKRGEGQTAQGLVVDGLWLADVPATGRFCQDESVRQQYRIDESGCWLWNGRIHDGYGVIYENGRRELAHRRVYSDIVDAPIDGLDLHHECMTKHCVNPDHLRPMTHADHMSAHAELRR